MFDNKPDNEFTILLKPNNDVFKHVTSFITSFDSIKHFNVNSYKIESNLDENNIISKKYNLQLKAPYGNYVLDYKKSKITINNNFIDKIIGTYDSAQFYEYLYIGCDDMNVINEFIEDARLYCDNTTKNDLVDYVNIYQYNSNLKRWNILSKFKKRNKNSVYLDGDNFNNIKNDIEKFIKSEDIYQKFGVPYKRNYLFYGLPGTGKTSVIFTLASIFNFSISILNFSPSIDDSMFMSIINNLPENSILVLEDIDSLFTDRNTSFNNKSMVSFSGVLNTLDGIGRKNKLITFLTTNFKDRLDPAILRPGRIDYKLEFTFATSQQISDMYDVFIGKEKYKKHFINSLKNVKLTTCILQKFFFENKDTENINDYIDILLDLSKEYNNNNLDIYT